MPTRCCSCCRPITSSATCRRSSPQWRRAAPPAAAGKLVTFGVVPDRAGDRLRLHPARAAATARRIAVAAVRREARRRDGAAVTSQSGEYYWNSGMFMFRARAYPRRTRAPRAGDAVGLRGRCRGRDSAISISRACRRAEFGACPSDSIDYAVMEKTRFGGRRAARCRLERRRFLVGAAGRAADATTQGNVTAGDVLVEDSRGCYLHSTSRLIAAVGLKDHVVVETKDAVLVAPRDRVQDVKQLVDAAEGAGPLRDARCTARCSAPGAATTASTTATASR